MYKELTIAYNGGRILIPISAITAIGECMRNYNSSIYDLKQ